MIDIIERPSPADEQRDMMLKQLFGVATPTHGIQTPRLNQRESLQIIKKLHSLMSISSPMPAEFGDNVKRANEQL
jgi:hypothetical protein